MQFTDDAGYLAVDQYSGRAPGVQGGVFGLFKAQLTRRQPGFQITLEVIEICIARGFTPLHGHDRAGTQHGQTLRLGKAWHGLGVGCTQEGAADFENAYPLGTTLEIEGQGVDQAADEAATHDTKLAGNRIGQLYGAGIGIKISFPLSFDEAVVDHFKVVALCQQMAELHQRALFFRQCLHGQTSAWCRGGNVVVAVKACQFLDQVDFTFDVETE